MTKIIYKYAFNTNILTSLETNITTYGNIIDIMRDNSVDISISEI